jgi:hypothetical protein
VRAAATFLLAAGLTVPALAVAPAAQAADPTVTSVRTDDFGRLNVFLNAADASWVQVSVRASAAADAPVLASSDDLFYASGEWLTPSAFSLPAGTAYGDYPVDVDYRLPGGSVQHWAGADHLSASDLNYRPRTSVSGLTFDRTTLDYDHRTTVASGTATTLDPATGQKVPSAGAGVELDWNAPGVHSATAVTDADGTFRIPLTLPGGLLNMTAKVTAAGADDILLAPTWWGVPQTVSTRYRINANESRTRVYPNVPFTEQGSVERYVNGSWQPWAGVTVDTADNQNSQWATTPAGVLGHAVTAADGSFSYPVTAPHTTDTYTFVHADSYITYTTGPYLFPEHIAVPTPGSLTTPTVSVDQYGTVTASGTLKGTCSTEPLSLEYSANGKTGWTNLKWFQANGGSTSCLYKTSTGGHYDGYYRVRHPETDVMQPAVSVGKRAFRLRTGMSIAMSSTTPKTNAKLTASGNVYQLTTSGWKPYAGVHVVLVFKPRYDTQWYWVVKGYTNAYGHYALNTQAFEDGSWAAYIEPNSSHYYTESKEVYVDAR